ncbi:hypothetical protein BJ994_000858 [Arthrobacter pigmenti]|uniref:Uncharacterized protein n=1 Tax=Arthrobacter pigmenti TaxID=271432 RepID=A0A846RMD8_9MICC|nr:hypothetical protein [Arthrobacter pigmenti]NJC21782.1 hypothetical protein [Arthrobacter pigmenti]
MALPLALSIVLVVSGLWTLIVWPPFLRRILKDPRSRNEHGAPTRFLKVHFMLITTSMILGAATLVIGIRTLAA